MRTDTVYISGMTCAACQNKIEKKLRAAPGIENAEVSYAAGRAVITYDPSLVTLDAIADIIRALDYDVLDGQKPKGRAKTGMDASRTVGLLVIIAALAMIVRQFGTTALFNAFPLAEAGMGYGMLFIIGLITSVHCIAMCGGINLSQCLPGSGKSEAALRPSLLYNLGRVVSYTAVGGVVGALGSAVSFSGRARGIVQLAAGVFMVIMGLNMLGIFPGLRALTPHLPRALAQKIDARKEKSNSPLVVGLLNGLMPCGPLQAMQLYALSTGSPAQGALSMLLFSLGTVPLMFALGAAGSLLSKKFTRRVMAAGAVIVAVMGLLMFSYGWSLGGLPSPMDAVALLSGKSAASGAAGTSGEIAGIVDGVQLINSTLSSGRYPAITVQAGIPVKWTINAPEGSINGCNNRMIIPEYGIEYRFRNGDNVIEFMPEKTGTFRYSCWMGMIRSSIRVTAQGEAVIADAAGTDLSAPVSAGYVIPTEEVALAEFDENTGRQRVRITLTDQGFSPAVFVMQAGIPAEWIIDNQSIEDGSRALLVPAYYTILPLEPLAENPIGVMPQGDFDFSTGDSIYFGYAKVVPDISRADLRSVRDEAAAFETLVYPEAYFYDQAGGASCCQ